MSNTHGSKNALKHRTDQWQWSKRGAGRLARWSQRAPSAWRSRMPCRTRRLGARGGGPGIIDTGVPKKRGMLQRGAYYVPLLFLTMRDMTSSKQAGLTPPPPKQAGIHSQMGMDRGGSGEARGSERVDATSWAAILQYRLVNGSGCGGAEMRDASARNEMR